MKIVINKKYGSFNLSEEAVLFYGDKKGLNIIAIRDEVIKEKKEKKEKKRKIKKNKERKE